ncbi:hypothetical protein P7C70_g3735, partial [Phenoliferia sp. Uapishka_3]
MTSPPVVFVTGASEGGIGFALCVAFAAKGCRVFASARRLAALEALPHTVERLVLDVTDKNACQQAVDEIISKAGKIDILVNNAGSGGTGAALDFDVDEAKKVFEVNFFSPSLIPSPWAAVYSSSKAALHSWSEVLRMEVKGLGVKVLLVAPGAITSGFGVKQLDSIKMPENSLYKSVEKQIIARAEISQRPDHSLPASVLAEGIVKRALAMSPPTYYSAGGKALLFWVFERLPRWFVWRLLAKALGTDKVGK